MAGVARSANLPRSTVVRLLNALEAEQLVRVDPATGRYEVGPGILELAGQYLARLDVRQITLPFLWELAAVTRETVNLAIQSGIHTVCVEQIEGPHAVRAVNWIGQRLAVRLAVHATAIGKAWLAFQPEAVVTQILHDLSDEQGQLPAYTAQTIGDAAALRDDLAHTRRRGYATTHEELKPWLSAVAAPLRGAHGVAVASIVVSGPSFRLTSRRIAEFGPTVVQVAARATAALEIGTAATRSGATVPETAASAASAG